MMKSVSSRKYLSNWRMESRQKISMSFSIHVHHHTQIAGFMKWLNENLIPVPPGRCILQLRKVIYAYNRKKKIASLFPLAKIYRSSNHWLKIGWCFQIYTKWPTIKIFNPVLMTFVSAGWEVLVVKVEWFHQEVHSCDHWNGSWGHHLVIVYKMRLRPWEWWSTLSVKGKHNCFQIQKVRECGWNPHIPYAPLCTLNTCGYNYWNT